MAETYVVSTVSTPHIVVTGTRGPSGGSASQDVTATTGEAISGYKLVVLDSSGIAFAASSSNTAHAGRIIGITTGAATSGAVATIRTYGEVTGLSGLTPGAIYYASTAGAIMTTAPTSGFVQAIGHATTTTKLFVRIAPPILL